MKNQRKGDFKLLVSTPDDVHYFLNNWSVTHEIVIEPIGMTDERVGLLVYRRERKNDDLFCCQSDYTETLHGQCQI